MSVARRLIPFDVYVFLRRPGAGSPMGNGLQEPICKKEPVKIA